MIRPANHNDLEEWKPMDLGEMCVFFPGGFLWEPDLFLLEIRAPSCKDSPKK